MILLDEQLSSTHLARTLLLLLLPPPLLVVPVIFDFIFIRFRFSRDNTLAISVAT
jgi:hypothetical protein